MKIGTKNSRKQSIIKRFTALMLAILIAIPFSSTNTFAAVNVISSVSKVVTLANMIFAILSNGTVMAWGANDYAISKHSGITKKFLYNYEEISILIKKLVELDTRIKRSLDSKDVIIQAQKNKIHELEKTIRNHEKMIIIKKNMMLF
jgi:hypothetical protein